MQKNFKKVIAVLLALALIITTLGAGIAAYFTGTDKKSDTYTIGQIEVEVVGDDNLYSAEKLTPNYEYEFTRSVHNIGINDAYVYMAVTLPYDEVYLHDLDGVHTANQAALTQLFTYGTGNIAGVSGEWKPVTEGKFGDYEIAQVANQLVNTSGEYGAVRTNDTVTYIYAYVGNGDTLARLAPDATTGALFDTMKFANVSDTVDAYNVEETTGEIKTQVFAIQADNVLETEYMTGNNADGSEAINAVWEVLNNALVRTHDVANDKISIPVTAKDSEGRDLNASATVIEGEDKEILLDALDNQGLANKEDVDLLIDVKSDDFDDLADTTIDVSEVAEEGDKVIILHYDETKGEWEFIAEDTVDENLTVGGDFSSFSPVAIIVIPKDEYMVLFVDKNGNPLKNAEVQIMGTSISGENDHGVVGFTDDEGYLHLAKADVEKFIKAQDEDDLFGEGPRAASEAGSCDVIFAIDKFVYVAAPEELGGEKETVSSNYAIHNVALYMVDDDYNFASASAIASALKAEIGDVLPDSVTYCPYGQGRLPNQSILLMDVNDPGNYDTHIMADWTSYEVVAQTDTTVTIKLISDAYDFSQVDIDYDGMTIYEDILGEFAIDGTDFTWTHTFEKKSSGGNETGPYDITIRILKDGAPVSGAYVMHEVDGSKALLANSPSVPDFTDANGEYTVTLEAGTYQALMVRTGAEPYWVEDINSFVADSDKVVVINITEPEKHTVTFKVVDANGQAIEGASVSWAAGYAQGMTAATDANGEATAQIVPYTGVRINSVSGVNGTADISTFDVNGDIVVTITIN